VALIVAIKDNIMTEKVGLMEQMLPPENVVERRFPLLYPTTTRQNPKKAA